MYVTSFTLLFHVYTYQTYVLPWMLDVLSYYDTDNKNMSKGETNYTGHNYHQINVKKIILCSDTAENLIHETMFNLEQSLQPENDIDSAYSLYVLV